ncbi:hypothetical protein P8848_04710 [Bacillus spizizenii]|nr:hypothetical protein [Bacillus spizizenii]MCY8765059.1 hypothetical protein [Bacillus spizizenii]MCY8804625.1 hypothetical protein [Bacillus spizizenii]MEC0569093.1 hypothetical protein [Bacillus spizizenii]
MPETVLALPGYWSEDLHELRTNLKPLGYIITGERVFCSANERYYEFDRTDAIEKMSETFYPREAFRDEDLKDIDSHTSCLYIIAETESVEDVRCLVQFIADLVKIDGIAVKIESSGRSFIKKEWLNIKQTSNLYDAMTTMIELEDGTYVTCGLHQFGEPDVMFTCFSPDELSEWFNNWTEMSESAKHHALEAGELKLSIGRAVLSIEPHRLYPEDDLFFNPYGIVIFERIDS